MRYQSGERLLSLLLGLSMTVWGGVFLWGLRGSQLYAEGSHTIEIAGWLGFIIMGTGTLTVMGIVIDYIEEANDRRENTNDYTKN